MRPINLTRYSRLDIGGMMRLALEDPAELVRTSEAYYNSQVARAAESIYRQLPKYKFILLCGPSASGKTTTAHKLKQRLVEIGVGARVISMDDFYTGIESYPLLPDGSRDMESIHAIDLNLLNRCFSELLNHGYALFPQFDFATQEQKLACHPMTLGENEVLIMEGIHALNPMVLSNIPRENIFRMYVSVRTKFMDGEQTVLVPKDLRLIRRMVRDYKFRNYPPIQTLNYWKHVVAGERVNIDLYRDDVHLKMDNTIDYEVCVWRSLLGDLLESELLEDYRDHPELENAFLGLSRFPALDYSLIPAESLLREFIGEEV